MSANPNEAEKHQKLTKIILITGLVLLAFGYVVLTDEDKPKRVIKKTKINYSDLVDEDELVKTKWMGEVSDEVKSSQSKVDELKSQIDKMQKMIIQLQQQKDDNTTSTKKYPIPINQNQSRGVDSPFSNNFTQPSKTTSFFNFDNKKVDRIANQVEKKSFVYEKQTNLLGIDEDSSEDKSNIKNEVFEDEDSSKDIDIVPTGSIFRVQLLSGFDAPTLAQAKTNPLPILMKIKDLSILPNQHQYDLKECFIVGEGYGNLSSERAYIRTNTLSCVTNSGKIIDTAIKGIVSGEDGKAGLRGRVVSKQGTVIANTIIATFIDSTAKAFGSQYQQTSVTTTGAVTTSSANGVKDNLKSGFYQGVGAGSSKLAEFFLKMADQVSPVIEIDSMREVDVILTSTLKLNLLDSKKDKDKKDSK
jgi:conjugal transfer pilus assembly protein TraB